jgi:hypothetical protein
MYFILFGILALTPSAAHPRRVDGYLTTLSVTQTLGCLLNAVFKSSSRDVICV